MTSKTIAYAAALALVFGAGIGISKPAASADSCATCRANYLNCLKSAGSNQTLIAWCNQNYTTCMDRC